MPQTDAALVAIAHPMVDVSSTAGLLAQFITNALLGLGHAARAQLVWPGDSGPVSTKSQRTGRQTLATWKQQRAEENYLLPSRELRISL
jgi:hypothetical protein